MVALGVQVPAHLPSEQLQPPGSPPSTTCCASKYFTGPAGDGDQLLPLRRPRGARDPRFPRGAHASPELIGPHRVSRGARRRHPTAAASSTSPPSCRRAAWLRMHRSSASRPSNCAPSIRASLAERMVRDNAQCHREQERAVSGTMSSATFKPLHRRARLRARSRGRWGNYGMEDAPLTVALQAATPGRASVYGGECRWPQPVPRRRCQRLRRQGHGGRPDRACATQGPGAPPSWRRTPSSWATPACTVPPAGSCTPPAAPVSASRCAIRARWR